MSRTEVAAAGFVACLAWVLSAQTRGSDRLSITIEKPSQKQTVGVRQDVAGKVSDNSATVWVVVQPRETADCWVQTPIAVNSDGSWQVMAQFGENIPSHSGKQYEVRALANPRTPLRVGRTGCWPEAEARSDPVYVVRQ